MRSIGDTGEMIPDEHRPMFAPGVRLQTDTATGQAVLLYPEGILELNETAHAIVKCCDGLTTVGQMVVALAAEYEIAEIELRKDVEACLDDLRQQKLIFFAR
jgi:pyrroloquinoline quinone biosynthesis protein D